MPNTVLKSNAKQSNGRWKETSSTVNVTHNNARLLHHSDGKTYEFIGLDGSGNRIYKDTQKVRG